MSEVRGNTRKYSIRGFGQILGGVKSFGFFNPLERGMSDVANLSVWPRSFATAGGLVLRSNRFELEKKLIFDAGPGYVGHQLMVPEAGNYRSLEWKDHGQMLLNGGSAGKNAGIWQMSNVCRHRQAIMLQGSRYAERPVVCPIHRWTYDRQGGELIGAPHFFRRIPA